MADSTQYYDAKIIANLFGVTVRRVQQITQEGIIETVEVPGVGRRYDLVPTIQSYIKYLSDKAYGRNKTEKENELREQKLKAEIALKESQGELHRLKTDIAAGRYVPIETVKEDYGEFFAVFKKFALSLPGRVVSYVSNVLDPLEVRRIEKEAQKEIRESLSGFVVAGYTEGDGKQSGRKKTAV